MTKLFRHSIGAPRACVRAPIFRRIFTAAIASVRGLPPGPQPDHQVAFLSYFAAAATAAAFSNRHEVLVLPLPTRTLSETRCCATSSKRGRT